MHRTAGSISLPTQKSRTQSNRSGCRAQSSDVKAPLSETSMGTSRAAASGVSAGGSSYVAGTSGSRASKTTVAAASSAPNSSTSVALRAYQAGTANVDAGSW